MGVLADPVTGKELRSVSRRWQTYVGRVLFVAATGALIYAFWQDAWKATISVSASASNVSSPSSAKTVTEAPSGNSASSSTRPSTTFPDAIRIQAF